MILRLIGGIYVSNYFSTRAHFDVENSTIVLSIGESTTAGLWVDYEDSYPKQLKKLLKQKYPEKNIDVAIPFHMGQNTGQVSNRIQQHIERYEPALIILMIGYNNEWSLAESHIMKFVKDSDSFKIKSFVFFDQFRIFRVIRYLFLRITLHENSDYIKRLEEQKYIFGGPELTRFPPEEGVYSFALDHQEEFVKLWKYDTEIIIQAAKQRNIPIILMTYHINPSYLSINDFKEIASKEDIYLVRNDLTFYNLYLNKTISDYISSIDNWHPNEKGYRIIAKNAYDAIVENKLLEKNDSVNV